MNSLSIFNKSSWNSPSKDETFDLKIPGNLHFSEVHDATTTTSGPGGSASNTSSTRSTTRDILLPSSARELVRDLKLSQGSTTLQSQATTPATHSPREAVSFLDTKLPKDLQRLSHSWSFKATPDSMAFEGLSSAPPPDASKESSISSAPSWQSEMSSLEQQKSRFQADQQSLMHNQMSILRRELVEVQKKFMDLKDDLQRQFECMNSEVSTNMQEKFGFIDSAFAQKDSEAKQLFEEIMQELKLLKAKVEIRDAAVEATSKTIKETQAVVQQCKAKLEEKDGSVEERIAGIESELTEKLESQTANALQGQLQRDALRNRVDGRLAKLEAVLSDITAKNTQELESAIGRSSSALDGRMLQLEARVEEALGRIHESTTKVDQLRSAHEHSRGELQRRLANLDEIVSDNVEKTAQAVASASVQNEVTKDTEKRISQMIQTQRSARETQESTLLSFIQDSRDARDALESSMHEQLRLERTARDVGFGQIKEQITREMQARQTYVEHYEEVLLKERAGRTALEQAVDERLKALEIAFSSGRPEYGRHDSGRERSLERRERSLERQEIKSETKSDNFENKYTHTSGPITKSDRGGYGSPRCPSPIKRVEPCPERALSESTSNSELQGVFHPELMSPRGRTPNVPNIGAWSKTLMSVAPASTPSTTSSAPSGHPSHQPPPITMNGRDSEGRLADIPRLSRSGGMSPGAPMNYTTGPLGSSSTAPTSNSQMNTPRVLAPGSSKYHSGSSHSLSASSASTSVARMVSYGSSSLNVPQPGPRSARQSPPAPPQRQRSSHGPMSM